MENSRYRWVIVAAGGLLGCVAIGGMFSLPVFLQPIARDTGWSVTGISSAMTIGFLAMAFTSMIWGTLSDRLGPLPVVLTGSVVLAASLGLASLATSLVAFQFSLRADGRRLDRRDLRADDGNRHRLVRYPSQPCGVAGLGRAWAWRR
jgi:MFS family permease